MEEGNHVTLRKRKHSEDHTEAFNKFSDRIMATLNNWKIEVNKDNSLIKESLDIVKENLVTINQNSIDLKTELQIIRSDYSNIKTTVQALDSKFKYVEKEIKSMQESTQYLSDQQEDIIIKVETLAESTKKIVNIESELNVVKKQYRELQLEMNLNDQRERLLNLEIVGVPEEKNEDLSDILLEMAKKIEDSLEATDIVQVNRVSPKIRVPGRPRNIIAKLTSRLLKDNIISSARKHRPTSGDLNISGAPKNIYVNEHLTISNKLLLQKCKQLSKEKNYQYVWAKHGRIYVRKNDTSPAILITSEEDQKKII
jgi:hypothetical protein